MKFIVVDDHGTFRESIKYYLENILNHEVINMCNDGLEFLELKNIHEADIILMDIEMPNQNGIDTVKKALWDIPYLNFIATTIYTEKAFLDELLEAGFKSCVFKATIYDELKDAIDSIMKKDLFFPEDMLLRNKKIPDM